MAAHHTGSVIEKLENGKVVVYVIRDDHWDEFRCEVWVDVEYCENLTYHTDNKKDAKATAKAMLQSI